MAAHIREKTVAVRFAMWRTARKSVHTSCQALLLVYCVRLLLKHFLCALTQWCCALQIVGGLLFIAFGIHAMFDKT